MRVKCGGLVLSIAVFATSIGRPAAAGDPATATMLFNEARRLVAAGRYPAACPKFEESERLDPGIGTQFNLADCYEHTQRTASAWALFLDVASAAGGAGQAARERLARKRADALEPKVSKLAILTPANVEGLEIRRNGELLGAMLLNGPTPVDPGSFTIEASAPGKKKWSTVATVGPDGAIVTVNVAPLEAAPSSPGAPAGDARGSEAPTASDAIGTAATTTWPIQRTVAVSVGGAGAIALIVGTVFGLRSIAKHSDYEALCSGTLCAPAAGPLHDDAVSAGTASTVAFVLGCALVGGGAVLWLTAPGTSGSSALGVTPTLGPSTAGATVRGAW